MGKKGNIDRTYIPERPSCTQGPVEGLYVHTNPDRFLWGGMWFKLPVLVLDLLRGLTGTRWFGVLWKREWIELGCEKGRRRGGPCIRMWF